jgi:hypothetical protein
MLDHLNVNTPKHLAQRDHYALCFWARCSGDVIFSIDDDAEFSAPNVGEQTLRRFCHPRIAAIAIPYMEPHKSQNKFQNAPDIDGIWVTDSFRGTSYALKRDVFLRLGGYREQLFTKARKAIFVFVFWIVASLLVASEI